MDNSNRTDEDYDKQDQPAEMSMDTDERKPDLPDDESGKAYQNGADVTFPVDISRDEFTRFNMIVSGVTGFLRLRRGQMIVTGILGAVTIMMLLSDTLVNRSFDPVMLLVLLFIAITGGMSFFGAPAYVRKAAERAYDQNRLNGQSYYGFISVYPDRIEKRNERNTVSISYQEILLYIETKDMIVLLVPSKPSIVLPSRCLTAFDLNRVRNIILPRIPLSQQRIQSRMIPSEREPVIVPDELSEEPEWGEEEALGVDVNYTREEFVKMATDTAGRGFLKMLPYYSVLSLVISLMFSFMYNFKIGIIIYIIFNGGMVAFQILGPKSRAGRAYDEMEPVGVRLKVLLKQPGIVIISRDNPIGVKLPWSSLTRAVERNDSVEFFSQSAFLRIPKRCIQDFSELRAFVDSHFHK